MTPQTTLMILAPVAEGRADDLRALLAGMTSKPGYADPDNELVPFGRFERLHVARFFIVEVNTLGAISKHTGWSLRPTARSLPSSVTSTAIARAFWPK